MKNINTEKLNTNLSLLIKGLTVVAISVFIYIGVGFYYNSTHHGPRCSKTAFQNWYQKKGTIISVNESKLQPSNGSTTCTGEVRQPNGSFVKWVGVITDTDEGYIGYAK